MLEHLFVLHKWCIRLLPTSFLRGCPRSSDLLLPAETLVALSRTMFLALVDTILIGSHSWGFDGVSRSSVEPIETIIFLPPIVITFVANFFQVGAEDGIVDLDGS